MSGEHVKSRDLLVMGEALVGLVPEGGTPFRRSSSLQKFTVGSEVNAGVAASRLGMAVTWLGRVGNDLAGKSVTDDLRNEGINLDFSLLDSDSFTGVLLRENVPLGQPQVSYLRANSAGSRLSPSDIPEHLVKDHRMVLTSGITAALSPSSYEAATSLLSQAKNQDVLAVLDLNYRSALWSKDEAGPKLKALCHFSDIVIGGKEEWSIVFGTDTPHPDLLPGATALIRTAGGNTSDAWVGNQHYSQPAFSAGVVDVVGAGDGFVGGLLSALLAGSDWPVALRQGAYCGARVVSALGDWTNLPWGTNGLVDIPANQDEVVR
jgi:2-dehydro-3-deoxygluconokinase